MLRQLVVICVLSALIQSVRAQNITRLDKTIISTNSLDDSIRNLMKAANVQGLAVSVFNNNKVVYSKGFGYKRIDTKDTFDLDANIYGASLSKAVFAVLVMKLVQDGLLDLDKPLESYLDKPIYEFPSTRKWHDNYNDLRSDTLYHIITARMCLDHTTGFANWRWDEPDQKLRVSFKPGSKYSYSGEGMVYLQVVLEHLFNTTLEALVQKQIFIPSGMKNSSYTWQPQFEKNYCIGHMSDGKLYEKDKDNDARAASTLETTVSDYTKFLSALLNGKLIKKVTVDSMFTRQIAIRSVQQFGPRRFRDSTLNDGIKLGYGLGWVLLNSPYGVGAFKEGHGDGFQHYVILYPEQKKGVLIMSNSDNAESIFKYLLSYSIADNFTPWKWENYIPYDQRN